MSRDSIQFTIAILTGYNGVGNCHATEKGILRVWGVLLGRAGNLPWAQEGNGKCKRITKVMNNPKVIVDILVLKPFLDKR